MTDTKMKSDIVDTVNRLMEEKPLSKITMKDIAIKCGISRQTLYYHFSNLDELVDYAFEERLTHFLERVQNCKTAEDILREMILLAQYSHSAGIFDSENRKNYDQACSMIKRIMTEVSDDRLASALSKSEYEQMISFYTYAMTGILKDFGSEAVDADKAAEELFKILSRGFAFKENFIKQNTQ